MRIERVGKERQRILDDVNSFFGSSFSTEDRVLVHRKKRNIDRIFIYSGSSLPEVRAEWIGLHFVTVDERGIVPTIEGAQLIGETAAKQVVDVSTSQALELFNGADSISCEQGEGIVIIRLEGLFIGVGLADGNRLHNLLPISRRIVRYRKDLG